MKRIAVGLLLLLVISGCSSNKEESFPQQEAQAERYLEYQRQGEWPELCEMLAPQELQRIREALGKPCPEAIRGKLAQALRSRAEGAEIMDVVRDGALFRVELSSGEMWIGKPGIYLERP